MNVRQLKKLIDMLPPEYLDRPVFYNTEFKDPSNKIDFEPESLTDIDEFVIDTEDNVIILRGVLGW